MSHTSSTGRRMRRRGRWFATSRLARVVLSALAVAALALPAESRIREWEFGLIQEIGIGGIPVHMALSPEQSRLYVVVNYPPASHREDPRTGMVVIDTASNTVISSVGLGVGFGTEVAITPDGSRACVSVSRFQGVVRVGDNRLEIVDLVNLQALSYVPFTNNDYGPNGVVISKDGTRAYVAHPGQHKIEEVDIALGQALPPISTAEAPWDLSLTPDGNYLYASFATAGLIWIDLRDRSTGTVVRVDDALHLHMDANGRLYSIPAVAAQADQLFAVENLARVDLIDLDDARARQLATSADGTTGFFTYDYVSTSPPHRTGRLGVVDLDRQSATYRDLIWAPLTSATADSVPSAVVYRSSPRAYVYVANTASRSVAVLGQKAAELVVDFAGYGLYSWENNSTWRHLHPWTTKDVVIGDFDQNGANELVADFGTHPGYGLYRYRPTTGWDSNYLHPFSADSLSARCADCRIPSIGRDDLVIDFGGYGVYLFNDIAGWRQLTPDNPIGVTATDLNSRQPADVIVNGSSGVCAYIDDASCTQIHAGNPRQIVGGPLFHPGRGDLVADFGSLWIYRGLTGMWESLHPYTAEDIVLADLDGDYASEVIVDFGALGLYAYYPLRSAENWVQINTTSPERLTSGDIDGSGRDEVIADFGSAYGIWARLDTGQWVSLHSLSPGSAFTVGMLDGQ